MDFDLISKGRLHRITRDYEHGYSAAEKKEGPYIRRKYREECNRITTESLSLLRDFFSSEFPIPTLVRKIKSRRTSVDNSTDQNDEPILQICVGRYESFDSSR
eukprot:TRINITY_DN1490_c0_g1_i2.p1 TRINITY_DN1490_c0_g1~~TRINITY_DN1490_c0_g1_i2.p1  ORF type:complete len:116 (-),score=5.47 TRINITY_DN1490_c0_g1_i2:398-706(-)